MGPWPNSLQDPDLNNALSVTVVGTSFPATLKVQKCEPRFIGPVVKFDHEMRVGTL
jgi:hypothetical protein